MRRDDGGCLLVSVAAETVVVLVVLCAAQGIAEPAVRTLAFLEHLAGGDLSTRLQEAQVRTASDETGSQQEAMVGAITGLSLTMGRVDGDAEQMRAAIAEIAGSTAQAPSMADDAVALSTSANESVTRLGHSSGEIGEILSAIASIAGQTNLLALNATIEAARGGPGAASPSPPARSRSSPRRPREPPRTSPGAWTGSRRT